ncbi:MAG TPA: Ku protein [Bryobacteraceae bacterium]|jgi:DNA end-binding protein Ku
MPAIVWKGYISFGLVSFPVRLFSAARPEGVHFHLLHRKDLSRVKEIWYCAKEDKPIERADIVKGYETSKGEYIVVEDEDLKKIEPPTAAAMEVIQFVREEEVDPIFFEQSYYVAPDENAAKPYTLFLRALAATHFGAIAKISMHNREHVVMIRAAKDGLLLHTLFYAKELHTEKKQASPAKANATKQEVDLAVKLIHQLAAPFKPEQFHDTYRENVERLIDEKKKGHTISAEPKPRKAAVVDLMEALKKSLKTPQAKPKSGRAKSSGRRTAA